MKIVKELNENFFIAEEDGEKVLLQKVDIDLSEVAEAMGDEEDEDEKKPAKKADKKEEKKPAKGKAKEEEDEEDDPEDDEETDLTWDDLKDMDYEELSEVVDDEELEDIDVEDYDEDEEDEVEKLRVAIAKELDIEVPKKGKKGKK